MFHHKSVKQNGESLLIKMKKLSIMLAILTSTTLVLPICASAEEAAQEEESTASESTEATPADEAGGEGANAVFTLDKVTVTGNRIEKKVYDTSADITVVGRTEIENMHLKTIDDALRTVPGVQFLDYGANLHLNKSGIRINGSNDVVILVDGVRVSDFRGAKQSGYAMTSVTRNMDSIERIEVLRGSPGVLYGSSAKGGVINIITRKDFANKTTISAAKGSYGLGEFSLGSQGKIGKLGYQFHYNTYTIGDTKDAKGFVWTGDTDQRVFGTSLNYRPNEKHLLSMRHGYSRMDFGDIYDPWYRQHIFDGIEYSRDLTLSHDFKISDRWANKMTYRRNFSLSRAHMIQGAWTYRNFWDNSYKNTFFSEQISYTSPKYEAVAGLDYSKGRDMKWRSYSTWPPTVSYRWQPIMENYSFYFNNTWHVNPKLSLEAGIRHDRPQRVEKGVVPRDATPDPHTVTSAKITFNPTKKDTIYAGRSEFFILPSMTQLYDTNFGNEQLLPAEGHGIELGYIRKFSDTNALTINFWDRRDKTTVGYASSGTYRNFKDERATGWNAQWDYQVNPKLKTFVSWARIDQMDVSGDNFTRGYRPKDVFNFGVNYNHKKWDVTLDARYFIRQDYVWTRPYPNFPSDEYVVANMAFNYNVNKHQKVYLKVNNVFNQHWAEHTEVMHRANSEGMFYTMPGRNFKIGMEYQFH